MAGKGGPWFLLGSLGLGAALAGGISWAIRYSGNSYESITDRLNRTRKYSTRIYEETRRKARAARRKSK